MSSGSSGVLILVAILVRLGVYFVRRQGNSVDQGAASPAPRSVRLPTTPAGSARAARR